MIRCETITITSGSTGAGTAVSTSPLSGEILSVRMPLAGTALTTGGTADFTFTRMNDGGTLLTVANQTAPWQYQPREAAHSTAGGTSAYATGVGPVLTHGPLIDGYLQVVVAQAAANETASVFVYYEDAR